MGCQCGHCHHDEAAHEHEHAHHEHKHHEHDHGHEHGHDHEHGGEENPKVMIVRLAVSAVLLAISLIVPMNDTIKLILLIAAALSAGYDVIWGAVCNLVHGHALDEMFLMTLASAGAFYLGDWAEGVTVLLLFQIGELFQDYAVDKSRDSISELMDIRPDYAFVEKDGKLVRMVPQGVKVGDVLVVKPGEKVPLDGEVIEGKSALNTVALTGESVPRQVSEGDQVLSGCINLQGVLRVRVSKPYAESTVARILELVEHASSNKSRADRFITRFAKIYTPAVVGAAVLVAVLPPLLMGGAWKDWLERALNFLVISCPCALVISVPLSFFGGIGGASRKGILVKGANYLEALANPAVVAFDKTGTLTRGTFEVTAVHPQGVEAAELLSLAAAAEQYSTHPIAASIRAASPAADGRAVSQVSEAAGHGVSACVDGRQVCVGNEKCMRQAGVAVQAVQEPGTIVYVAADGKYLGYIVINDEIKPGAAEAIQLLRRAGVKKTVMLTGDSPAAAAQVAQAVGVDEAHAGLLPDGKVAQEERLLAECKSKGSLIFVGDGINDAPVLARADVGVAMGALGSDAAIEAADVVLMDDDPRKLATAVRIARKTSRIVRENIIFSLAVKALVMLLGVLGVISLWMAVFSDVGVCFLAILNAMRAMRVEK